MDTVLAGADGKSAAIDQATGQPLTIEDLLRRRGLLAVNGATRLNGQAPAVPLASTAQPNATAADPNALAAVMAARQGGGAVAGPNGGATAIPTPPQAAPTTNSVAAAPVDPNAVASDTNGSVSVDPNVLAPLGVGAAAGLGWALASRRKKSNGTEPAGLAGGGGTATMPGTAPTNNSAVLQSGMIEGTRQLPRPPINAEFTEVNPLVKLLTDKRVLKALTRVK